MCMSDIVSWGGFEECEAGMLVHLCVYVGLNVCVH
jgi:hypothetical protein